MVGPTGIPRWLSRLALHTLGLGAVVWSAAPAWATEPKASYPHPPDSSHPAPTLAPARAEEESLSRLCEQAARADSLAPPA